MELGDNLKWWLVLIVTLVCGLSLPGLIQMLIDEIKKGKDEEG